MILTTIEQLFFQTASGMRLNVGSRLTQITHDDAYLKRCQHPASGVITGFSQLIHQIGIAAHQVMQVLYGGFSVLRAREIQHRQLAFGVRTDAESEFFHIVNRLM